MCIELAVHEEHIVALVLRSLNEGVLGILVGGIEIHDLVVLVGLVAADGCPVLVEAEILAVHILQEGELQGLFAELLIGEHTILDEEFEIVPFLLVCLSLGGEYLFKTGGYLLGHVT